MPVITGFVPTSPKCFGYTDGSIVINYSAGTAPYNVTWSNPINQTTNSAALTQSVAGVASGVYTATLTDSYGCTTSAPVVVTPTPKLILLTTADATICFNQTTQISASASGGTGAYSYTWSPNPFVGGGPHTVTLTTTSVYNVAVSDVNGCQPPSKNITITVTPSLSILPNLATVCDGKAGALSPVMTSNGNGGPYTYAWNPSGATTNSIIPAGYASGTTSTSVTYTLLVSDGCSPSAIGVFTLNTNPNPTADFVASKTVACAPSAISFTALPATPGDYAYQWIDDGKNVVGTTNPFTNIYTSADSLDVTLVITNTVTGCYSSLIKTNYIVIHKQPIASFYADPQSTTILDPNINFINTSQGATNYYWDFGDVNAIGATNNSTITNPTHYYNSVGSYNVYLLATSIYGCKDTANLIVEIKPDFAMYIPNSFTPDGNGLNDVFQPAGVGINEDNYRMEVFDRWGESVFTSNAFRKGWDGTVKGGSKIAEQGVYVYKLEVFDMQGNKHPYIGHVTLIKKEN